MALKSEWEYFYHDNTVIRSNTKTPLVQLYTKYGWNEFPPSEDIRHSSVAARMEGRKMTEDAARAKVRQLGMSDRFW